MGENNEHFFSPYTEFRFFQMCKFMKFYNTENELATLSDSSCSFWRFGPKWI